MGFGLKIFWGLILTAICAGLIYVSIFNIPSPSVEVKKNIELSNRFQ